MLRRTLAVALPVAAAAALGLAGCHSGDPDRDRPDPDGIVRVAIQEPPDLLPTGVAATDGAQVLAALFTPLVGFDPAGQPVPLAAESVEPDPERRVWTVRLREGWTFHNGEPVTADSYLRAWNFGAYQPHRQRNNYYYTPIAGYPALNPGPGATPATRTLSGLARQDDLTFTVALAEPFAEFPAMLAAPAFHPLPQAAFAPDGGLVDGFATAPVGNGPFRLVEWRPGDRIVVERYPDYPGDPARVGGVEFVSYPDATAAYADLRAGDVEVVTEIPPGKLATVATDLGDRFRQVPGGGFQFLAFPAYETGLADPQVRRAISMAIDRDELVSGIFRDTQTAARGFVPPVVPGADPDGCGPACRFDPATARDAYHRAGGPDRLTITYNADGRHHGWVAATCDQLRAHLDVPCTGQPVPTFADLLSRLDTQEPVGMVRFGWTMDFPSVASYLHPVFATDGTANLHGYRNPELDALLAAAAAASSPEIARDAYHQAEQILARDLPVIPLRFGTRQVGHAPGVRGVTVTRMGQLDLTELETAGQW